MLLATVTFTAGGNTLRRRCHGDTMKSIESVSSATGMGPRECSFAMTMGSVPLSVKRHRCVAGDARRAATRDQGFHGKWTEPFALAGDIRTSERTDDQKPSSGSAR